MKQLKIEKSLYIYILVVVVVAVLEKEQIGSQIGKKSYRIRGTQMLWILRIRHTAANSTIA
jgi:hypothetical protein